MKRLVLTLTILFSFALGGMAQLSFGFESGHLQGWTTIDGDGDGHTWQLSSTEGMGHFGTEGMVLSYSVDPVTGESLMPNDYLISPLLYEQMRAVSFWVCALDTACPAEHVGIAVSTTVNNDITAFSLIQEWTLINQGNWCRYVCDLSQFVGQRKYVAIIHHNSGGNSAVCIDDVYIRSDVMEAQSDVWKPFYAPHAGSSPVLPAVAQNGDLFSCGYEGLYRSQDEGETWVNILNTEPFYPYEDEVGFVIGQEGRIFYASEYDHTIYYSDDGGDTWQEIFCENLFFIYPSIRSPKLYSPSNEILLYWSGDEYDYYDDKYLFYTLDNGETWNEADMSFITGQVGISDVIVNETGDVYVSVYSDSPQPESTTIGVYHSTLSDMQSWELVAFEGIGVIDMDFDPDGNVLCAVYLGGDFSGFEHVPGFYAFSAQNVCVSDNGIIYKTDHDENYTTVMLYSLDHGEHFYNTSQTFILYVTYWVSPRLIKGHDNHLYFHADAMEESWKSIPDADNILSAFPEGSEWYYEIQNENGSITYQYMYQAGDTIVQDEPTHILVKINTLYDKDFHVEITHEYVYERDGKLYWWNKTLEEFTVLYDFGAQEGDEWEIKVGNESLIMHVDAVEDIAYEGRTWRMLHVSDADDLFSGNIVSGIGHLTSFFPERLMDNGDGVRVEGMRCYWVDNELVFKYGDEDCDAIYSDLHGIEEDGPSTPSTGLVVYPNPTNGVLFVQTLRATSLHTQTYCITNLTGQILLQGQITAETQQIDVSNLPEGMYFISIGGETRKFVVR